MRHDVCVQLPYITLHLVLDEGATVYSDIKNRGDVLNRHSNPCSANVRDRVNDIR
jgi:hypothetical protein